jgi:sugar phosphate isomerase/epimerase
MKRREFFKSAAAGAALAGVPAEARSAPGKSSFVPSINQATSRKADFKVAMEAYSKAGFRVVELWLDSVQPFLARESVVGARRVMEDCQISPRSACCDCEDLFFRGVPGRGKKMEAFRRKLDLSSQLGANRFVLCSGIAHDITAADYDAAVPMLHEIGDLGRQFGIVIGVEFIRGAKFLGCVETTANLLRRVGHPNLGVLVDTFHFYAGVSKLADIANLKPGEISWVHINDVPAKPREMLEDMDRVYVGDGVMPLEDILHTLARVYRGPVSFEVFQYADQDPLAVARKAFEGLSRLLARV